MSDKSKILVVDDDDRLLEALTLFLGQRGYQVSAKGCSASTASGRTWWCSTS
jgi:DNA-binding response OmpR family regulator